VHFSYLGIEDVKYIFIFFRTTSKEAKRMVCDCFLTKDEIARGEMGCGEDCLNRLLMIEW
jgi:histone-lysine N-methyltransferase SETD2